MKRIISALLINLCIWGKAFADIIDPGPYPGDFPKPVPAPEPEDDGEVVVIKILLIAGMIITMAVIAYVKNKQSKVKEY